MYTTKYSAEFFYRVLFRGMAPLHVHLQYVDSACFYSLSLLTIDPCNIKSRTDIYCILTIVYCIISQTQSIREKLFRSSCCFSSPVHMPHSPKINLNLHIVL